MSLKVSRSVPSPRLADGVLDTESPRASGYGEPYQISLEQKRYALLDEGSYFVALNPTAGTGVAGHAAPTTMDNTKPFILIQNTEPSGGKRLYLDRIRLAVTAAGTAGTLNYATHILDSGAGYTSGGSSLTPVSPNGDLSPSVSLLAYAGAVVATAGSNQRIVSHQRVRTVIPVVGDVVLFDFAGDARSSGMVLEGTTEVERLIACPPVIVAPQQWYKLVLWRASQSAAASYELEIGFWVR